LEFWSVRTFFVYGRLHSRERERERERALAVIAINVIKAGI
jgi:hypothetical protein